MLHVVNHATLHRGQVMGMIRQLGIAPPVTDLIFYEWSR
ncbi:MAG: DinB family protein [Acidobacteriota bacterium]